jgi:hypothetical protein
LERKCADYPAKKTTKNTPKKEETKADAKTIARQERRRRTQSDRRDRKRKGLFEESETWHKYTAEEVQVIADILREHIDQKTSITSKNLVIEFRARRPKDGIKRELPGLSCFVHRHSELKLLRDLMRA